MEEMGNKVKMTWLDLSDPVAEKRKTGSKARGGFLGLSFLLNPIEKYPDGIGRRRESTYTVMHILTCY